MNRQGYSNYGYIAQQRQSTNYQAQFQSPSTSGYSPYSRANVAVSPLVVPRGYLNSPNPNNSPNCSIDMFATPPPSRRIDEDRLRRQTSSQNDNNQESQSLSDAIRIGMDMVDNDVLPVVPMRREQNYESRPQPQPQQRPNSNSTSYSMVNQQKNFSHQQMRPHQMVPSPAQILHSQRNINNYGQYHQQYVPQQHQQVFYRNSPSYQQQTQLSMDPFETQRQVMPLPMRYDPSRADRSSSILAAVSSTHSNPNPQRSGGFAVPQQPKPTSRPPKTNFFDQWNPKKSKKGESIQDDMRKQMEDDFMPYGSEKKSSETNKKAKPKQIRMDDYLFKARRVDKGCREFGLKTTHEPKRGSKKKRESEEKLEIEAAIIKEKESLDDLSSECDTSAIMHKGKSRSFLDATIPLTSFASPENKKDVDELDKTPDFNFSAKNLKTTTDGVPPKKSNVPAFRKLYQQYNNGNDLSETVPLKTPEKVEIVLDETVPLKTPSPARSRNNKRKFNESLSSNSSKRSKGPMTSTQILSDTSESPLKFMFSQSGLSSSKKKMPVFDIPSPIVLSENEGDDDEVKDVKVVSKHVEKREILKEKNSKREVFGKKVSERELMIKELVSDDFVEQRAVSMDQHKEIARTALKDGEVIRNKGDRQKLMHGKSCKCCQGYYDNLEMTPEGKKQYIDQISRHRYVNMALPDTPERYWDLTMGPSDEQLMGESGKEKEERKWTTNEKATRVTLATWDRNKN